MRSSIQKVIEYVIDPNRKCVGEVPQGKPIKVYKGKKAMLRAMKHADKLNEAQALIGPDEIMKGYYVKGDF